MIALNETTAGQISLYKSMRHSREHHLNCIACDMNCNTADFHPFLPCYYFTTLTEFHNSTCNASLTFTSQDAKGLSNCKYFLKSEMPSAALKKYTQNCQKEPNQMRLCGHKILHFYPSMIQVSIHMANQQQCEVKVSFKKKKKRPGLLPAQLWVMVSTACRSKINTTGKKSYSRAFI